MQDTHKHMNTQTHTYTHTQIKTQRQPNEQTATLILQLPAQPVSLTCWADRTGQDR